MSGVGVGGTADDAGRRPQLAPPLRQQLGRRSRPGRPPSSVAKPAGTSSRSPCHPQRKSPSIDGDDLLVRARVGASSVYPSAERTSSGIIARGECRLGAGLKSKSSPAPPITGQGELGERETEELGVARHGRRIDLDRGHRLREPPVRQARQRRDRRRAGCREPSSDRSTRTPSGRCASPNSITPATVVLLRFPAPARPGQGSTMGKPVMKVSRWSKTASRAGRVTLDRGRAGGDHLGERRVLRGHSDQVGPRQAHDGDGRGARVGRQAGPVVQRADGRARASTARRCR